MAQDQRVTNQEQQIQNKLTNDTNLTAGQQTRLDNRLTNLQSVQTNMNSALSTDLSNRQTRLQSELSSGNLSAGQQAFVQNRLNQTEAQEAALSSTGSLGNTSPWTSTSVRGGMPGYGYPNGYCPPNSSGVTGR